MLNKRLLRGKAVEKGLSIAELSNKLNMNPATFYRRMKNSTFTIVDIDKMIDILKLTQSDIMKIFFN